MEELPEPRPAHLLARGSYDAPREEVRRDTPASLPPFPADQPRNRLGLARWLTQPTESPHRACCRQSDLEDALRAWARRLARGLREPGATADASGSARLARRPLRRERLGREGPAPPHRVVGHLPPGLARVARVVTRATRRTCCWPAARSLRLPAEHIRDGALAASGLLVRSVGGASVKPYQPEGLWEQSGTGQTYTQDTGDKVYRRSLYTFWRRTSPPPSMTTFDAVSREVCVARREVTVTPLQSLVLLNDPQFVEAARVLAEQLVRTYPRDPAARHREAFRRLIGRHARHARGRDPRAGIRRAAALLRGRREGGRWPAWRGAGTAGCGAARCRRRGDGQRGEPDHELRCVRRDAMRMPHE